MAGRWLFPKGTDKVWVTQTYLGTVEPNADVFIYYLFEEYNWQMDFTEKIQLELEKLGEVFGDRVSLLMPNPRYAGRIEAEVRKNEALWARISGKLPGLLVTTAPFVNIDPRSDECVFVSFEGQDSTAVAEVILKVRRLAGDTLSWKFANRKTARTEPVLERFWSALEIRPSLGFLSFDVKKFFGLPRQ